MDQWTLSPGATRCLLLALNSIRHHHGVYLKQVNHLEMAYASLTYKGSRDSFNNIDIMIHVERASYTNIHLIRPSEDRSPSVNPRHLPNMGIEDRQNNGDLEV